jgi:tetratricopeptide (TPR) repeat protein
VFLGLCYERLGRIRDAVSEWNIAIRYSRANPVPVAILGQMCAAACKRTSAGRWVKTLHRLSERRFVPACALAASYTRLGQADKAFEWLEKAFSERSTWLVYMNVDPLLDNVRSDPRFERLVRRVGLPSPE